MASKHAIIVLGWACLNVSAAWAVTPCRADDPYFAAVEKVIEKAVGRPAELALTVFPSFEEEYGVRMIGSDIVFVQLRSSFWASSTVSDGPGSYHHDFSVPRVRTTVARNSLSPAVAQRVKQRFAQAIAVKKNSGWGGLDGITYRFTIPTVGCGETWSPQANSVDAQLVELAEQLAEHAQSRWPWSTHRSEQKILRTLSDGKSER